MRGPIWILVSLALLLALGRQLSRRPPDWIRHDPLLHPFGLDPELGLSDEDRAEDGPPLVSPEHPLDINRASAYELTALPRVGPVIAGRILAMRDSLGGFRELEQLTEVKGVGPRTLEGLRPLVRLGKGP